MKTASVWLTLLILVSALFSIKVWAGSQANSEAQYDAARIATFAKQVERYTAQRGTHAFIIGRVGRPESDLPRGIQFTHTAVAIYSRIELQNGDIALGYAIHNLYQMPGNHSKSERVTDYPVDFFWGAQAMKAGIIIPDETIQQRLIALIHNDEDKTLHNPNYSVLANPFNSHYQNCTEYTLDLINAAIYNTLDTARLKANASAYFAPQTVHVSKMKLALGAMVTKGLSTRDHNGKVATATFGSLYRYLNQYQLVNHATVLHEDGKSIQL